MWDNASCKEAGDADQGTRAGRCEAAEGTGAAREAGRTEGPADGRRHVVPDNITIRLRPSYSPELNPIERLWAYMRSHNRSNRAYDDYKHLLDTGAAAWQKLTPELLSSVCNRSYLTHEIEERSV